MPACGETGDASDNSTDERARATTFFWRFQLFWRAWRRFHPASSQPLDGFLKGKSTKREMEKSIIKKYGIFIMVFVLTFYGLGASIIDHYVIYPTLPIIGENEFVAYYAAFSPRILLFLVLPVILQTVLTFSLLWLRPQAIPLWMVLFALACQTVRWISTVFIQVPIQIQLGKGKNLELINMLMQTGLIRTLSNVLGAAIIVWMMFAVLRSLVEMPKNTSVK